MLRLLFIIAISLTALHLMAQKRVVSLSPSITYTIVQIGAENTIVGRTSYCPNVDNSIVVGDVMTINIESIIALKPDVVFCMAFTKENTIKRLQSLGIEVVNFNTPTSFDEIAITTLKIGKHIGEPAKTQTYLSKELDKIAELKKEITNNSSIESPFAHQNSKTAMFQIGANPLWVVTPNTYMNEYLTTLGIYNIVKSTNGQINREFVITEQPNIIFMSDMGDTGLAQKEIDQWKRLIPNCKTVIVDANKSCCPTPQFFRETLELMHKAITEE
ncbi:MAG: helical backbone metal receptor [Bacteroidia bacterium]|nr:helical backbone metal receptor [Bacteroidia bacterium]